ncbi:SDR family NAD(P)-dependent oxidoreductase [Geobacter sp. SVR]|uniref:SDR family NAD(P)-dependent oxidoreductase n=1 Tax=Geobacter sp. SVR TaxID=2495594 RepID=UPI00143EF601|nr:SDR family oxidoreductase [Geobacter sp. SVR]BCS53763.1 NAD(P)-dependent oxidoreductase [Geobacter sp. SVR]GCF85728.1 NAD(P)-dependent oxidoreductase [Geobacter sp. SVR]
MASSRVVVITGAGSGIGRATALTCAGAGTVVAVCGRSMLPLRETASLVETAGGAARAYAVDVRETESVRKMVKAVVREFERIDVLVNNAGVIAAKPFLASSDQEWNEQIAINLTGTYNCCRAVLPSMVAAGEGVIVNISSVLGRIGIAGYAGYSASKFGVIGLTQSLADEYRGSGIRVYAVCPGGTDTPLHRSVVGDEEAKNAMAPSRVAGVIVDLFDPSPALPSGKEVVVDDRAVRTPWMKRFLEKVWHR